MHCNLQAYEHWEARHCSCTLLCCSGSILDLQVATCNGLCQFVLILEPLSGIERLNARLDWRHHTAYVSHVYVRRPILPFLESTRVRSHKNMDTYYCEPGEPAGYPIRIPIPRIQQRSIPETVGLEDPAAGRFRAGSLYRIGPATEDAARDTRTGT